MRKRYLTIIKNQTGLNEYNSGVEHSKNLKTQELPEKEFETLCKSGIFKTINNTCDLMIDDYESEIIESKDLEKCIEIVKEIDAKEFFIALTLASKNGIALALDF